MSLRPLARSFARHRPVVFGVATCLAVACAERAQRAGAAETASPPESAAVRQAAVRAPRDTVDSLDAARRATVLDTRPLPPASPPKAAV